MGGEAAVTQMHFCGLHTTSLKQFLKVTEVRKVGRMAVQMELWRIWFPKELGERNEQSQVDNNEPDKVQMLIKCFESLGCFASFGTRKI